ncbi:hypothetical protein TRE132_14140 [Pseudomonas chlororaphis subsp. aurantiaca]|nr:hypothetical protein TRE132_14140 [Pseudomonas chlororaphis subsp. aurantiaca]
MLHLRSFTRTLHRQQIDGVTFHFDPSHRHELDTLLRRFLAKPEQYPTLDIPEDTRGCSCSKANANGCSSATA